MYNDNLLFYRTIGLIETLKLTSTATINALYLRRAI